MAYEDPYKSPQQQQSSDGAGRDRPGPKPKNWLIESILATLCCCLPLGIVSIVFAAQVDSKWRAGDHAGAMASADKAKTFFWIAFGLGIVVNALAFGAQFALASGELGSGY